ncbi:MAG: hypothetical protein HY894_04350 [Deltaproteobacteria bacterium]|nr:hypothetical protein [Deltaproteobacteria bacterium]
MDRQIRIKILPDGRVEIDSTVFTDCKEVAEHLTRNLGAIESFVEKDEEDVMRVKIETGEQG